MELEVTTIQLKNLKRDKPNLYIENYPKFTVILLNVFKKYLYTYIYSLRLYEIDYACPNSCAHPSWAFPRQTALTPIGNALSCIILAPSIHQLEHLLQSDGKCHPSTHISRYYQHSYVYIRTYICTFYCSGTLFEMTNPREDLLQDLNKTFLFLRSPIHIQKVNLFDSY